VRARSSKVRASAPGFWRRREVRLLLHLSDLEFSKSHVITLADFARQSAFDGVDFLKALDMY
jgi:hypothetical protein